MPAEAERLGVSVSCDMERGLAGADIVMMSRLQRERMQRSLVPRRANISGSFGLMRPTGARKAGCSGDASRPMNRGVENDTRRGRRSTAQPDHEQVEMGVAVRMAVLDTLSRGHGRNDL